MTDASGLQGSYFSCTLDDVLMEVQFQDVDDFSQEPEGWFGACPKGVARKRPRPIDELVSDSSESSISDATAIRWYEAFQSRVASSRPTLRSSNIWNHLLDLLMLSGSSSSTQRCLQEEDLNRTGTCHLALDVTHMSMTRLRLARLLLGAQREGSRYFAFLPFSAGAPASVASRQAAPSEGGGRCRTSPR